MRAVTVLNRKRTQWWVKTGIMYEKRQSCVIIKHRDRVFRNYLRINILRNYRQSFFTHLQLFNILIINNLRTTPTHLHTYTPTHHTYTPTHPHTFRHAQTSFPCNTGKSPAYQQAQAQHADHHKRLLVSCAALMQRMKPAIASPVYSLST